MGRVMTSEGEVCLYLHFYLAYIIFRKRWFAPLSTTIKLGNYFQWHLQITKAILPLWSHPNLEGLFFSNVYWNFSHAPWDPIN